MKRLGRPVTHKDTTFAKWMAEMGFTNDQAAAALGLSLSRIRDLKAGKSSNPTAGGEPDQRTLLAMAAIKAGIAPYEAAA